MNYQRVYDRFIADRRAKEKGLKGYSERHHIQPKALGGSDARDNLIRLTPEDHFFAHLCLAKIHGGTMWAPIAFMVGAQRKDWKPSRSRKQYGWLSRKMAQAIAKAKTLPQEHRLKHMDGRTWAGRQTDMTALGLSKSLANMLVKGRVNSAKGWYLAGNPRPERGGANHPMYRRELIEFRHDSGEVFVGTQHQFHLAHGLIKSAVCRLVRGQAKSWHGWRVGGGLS